MLDGPLPGRDTEADRQRFNGDIVQGSPLGPGSTSKDDVYLLRNVAHRISHEDVLELGGSYRERDASAQRSNLRCEFFQNNSPKHAPPTTPRSANFVMRCGSGGSVTEVAAAIHSSARSSETVMLMPKAITP